MAEKHSLSMRDFDDARLWTFDDEADDGTFVPLTPRFYNSGELAADAVFAKNAICLADGTTCEAIIGLCDVEEKTNGAVSITWRVYMLQLHDGTRDLCVNIPLQADDSTLEPSLCGFFGRSRADVFPLRICVDIEAIGCRMEEVVE